MNVLQILKISVAMMLCVFPLACSSGDPKPENSELASALKEVISEHLDVVDFEVTAKDFEGSNVNPKWRFRYQATVSTVSDLYKLDEKYSFADVMIIEETMPQGADIDIGGVVTSAWENDAWEHAVSVENGNIFSLGKPLDKDSYDSRTRFLVLGSEDQIAFLAEQKHNIANAAPLLVGKWKDDKATFVCNADGTAHLQETVSRWKREYKGTWRVSDYGMISFQLTHEKTKSSPEWDSMSKYIGRQSNQIEFIDHDYLSLDDMGAKTVLGDAILKRSE